MKKKKQKIYMQACWQSTLTISIFDRQMNNITMRMNELSIKEWGLLDLHKLSSTCQSQELDSDFLLFILFEETFSSSVHSWNWMMCFCLLTSYISLQFFSSLEIWSKCSISIWADEWRRMMNWNWLFLLGFPCKLRNLLRFFFHGKGDLHI